MSSIRSPSLRVLGSFTKVNLGGRGYVHLSLNGETRSPMAVDRLLPSLRERPSLPSVAYSATWTGKERAVAAVGGYWPWHQDEFGRRGISFWYGEDWDLDETRELATPVAARLIAIVSTIQTHYEELGRVLSMVAKNSDSVDIRKEIILPLRASDFRLGKRGQKRIRDIIKESEGRATGGVKTNFLICFPYDWRVGIPLLSHLLVESRQVNSIGGGDLADDSLVGLEAISVDFDAPGFESAYVGEGGYSQQRITSTPSSAEAEVRESAVEILEAKLTRKLAHFESGGGTSSLIFRTMPEAIFRLVKPLLVVVGIMLGAVGVVTKSEWMLEISTMLLLLALITPRRWTFRGDTSVENKEGETRDIGP